MRSDHARVQSPEGHSQRSRVPSKWVLLTAWAASLAGCTARRDAAGASRYADRLCIDGLMIDGGAGSLWDVLASHVRTRQWLDNVQSGSPGPLVLIDGREVDGLGRLSAVSAREVRSVEKVEPELAVAEYGPRGRDGAIVINMQYAPAYPSAPHRRMPQRCR